MNAEEWLARVRGADVTVRWLTDKYLKELTRATSVTAPAYGDKVQTEQRNRTEDKFVQVSAFAAQLKQAIEKKEKICAEIVDVIKDVEDEKKQLLLWLYYIDGKTWKEVSAEMGYSEGYIGGVLRKAAIQQVQRILDERNIGKC